MLTTKQQSAIDRAKREPRLQPLLFRKAEGVRWFAAFKAAGFLQAEGIPSPIPAEDEGFVSIPPWPITDSLADENVESACWLIGPRLPCKARLRNVLWSAREVLRILGFSQPLLLLSFTPQSVRLVCS